MNIIKEQSGLKHWNRVARYYSLFRFNPISYYILNKEQKSIRDLIAMRINISDSGRALDMGTGNGLSLNLIPPDISHIHAIDQSAEMATKTRNNYNHVEVITGNALETPYENECMDLILCVGVSEYIADIKVLLGEIFRVLKTGGFAVFTSSPPNYLNHIRKLSGHNLYLRSATEMTERIFAGNFNNLGIKEVDPKNWTVA